MWAVSRPSKYVEARRPPTQAYSRRCFAARRSAAELDRYARPHVMHHNELERFFLTDNKAGIRPQHANRIRLILALLQQPRMIDGLRIPTLRLHELKGGPKDTWSVTVQANWRITWCIQSPPSWRDHQAFVAGSDGRQHHGGGEGDDDQTAARQFGTSNSRCRQLS